MIEIARGRVPRVQVGVEMNQGQRRLEGAHHRERDAVVPGAPMNVRTPTNVGTACPNRSVPSTYGATASVMTAGMIRKALFMAWSPLDSVTPRHTSYVEPRHRP